MTWIALVALVSGLVAGVMALDAESAWAIENDSSSKTRADKPVSAGLSIGLPKVPRVPRISLFDVALPMKFHARLGGVYTYTPFLVDALAFDRWNRLGPQIRTNHFFESRFSIGRPLQPGVELEVAWSSQSMLSMSSGPSFDRQTVGAFIRFVR